MASPKVFVSSTCFDLSEIREQLRKFISSFGFDPVLSEHGDVFYHPDLHTHDSCIHEIANCNLFVLLIGGRFGGEYVADKTKSIVNAEYLAARECGLPVFTYVKSDVFSNHHIYQQNKNASFAKEIKYPAIEKQDHAADIFEFINDVRKSPVNNAFEAFSDFNRIETHLRKQWAGLFFELLKSREFKKQIDATNHLMQGLTQSSSKLEELIKSFYIGSDKERAEKEISNIEVLANTKKFFIEIFSGYINGNDYGYTFDIEKIDFDKLKSVDRESSTYSEFLVSSGLFSITDFPKNLDEDGSDEYIDVLQCEVTEQENKFFCIDINQKKWQELYESGLKIATPIQIEDVFSKVIESLSPTSLL